jgi:hypothetical protein
MPGFLLNAASTVICSHGGQAKSVAPNPRVRVMGMPATTQLPPYAIVGCANPPPPANVGPCLTAPWILAALRVKVMGVPVLLQDSQAICIPTGTPLIPVMTQIRVRGM